MSDASAAFTARDGARRTALGVLGVAVAMGGLAFAAVPFYDWFCRTTGFAGVTMRAEGPSASVVDRLVTVRFDANTAQGMPWRFRPERPEMRVKLGESALAFYRAENPTAEPISGAASFNVSPPEMGAYFAKVDCFCFEEQTLAPGQVVDMPVSFYVDPAMLDDPETRDIEGVTLSYTFHRTETTASAR